MERDRRQSAADIRDGLRKPSASPRVVCHGRMGNDWNKPYKKSARIVGDVIR